MKTKIFYLLVFTINLITSLTAQDYAISDVGTLITDTSKGLALNNKGQVAGTCKVEGVEQLFLWSQKQGLFLIQVPTEDFAIDIPTPIYSEPYEEVQKQINISDHNFRLTDQGTIFFSLSITHTFTGKKGSSNNTHRVSQNIPILWNEKTGMQKIELPFIANFSIHDVNNDDTALIGFMDQNNNYHSVTYKNGLINFIDNLTVATQINDKGEIAGFIKLSKDLKTVSILALISNNILITTDKLSCATNSFNSNSEVVIFEKFDSRNYDYWIYNIKTKNSIYIGRIPYKIVNIKTNKNREVLLSSQGKNIIFTKSRSLLDLNKKFNLEANIYSKWSSIIECKDLNEKGQLVGSGQINGRQHALLLSPIR